MTVNAAAPSETPSAPRIGAQRPRVEHSPTTATRSLYEMAVDLAALAGLYLDAFQEYLLEHAMGVRSDGKWAAFQVAYEIARQNGKSAVVEARILAGLFLIPHERKIIYSAHEYKTAVEIFNRLVALIENAPALNSRVKRILNGNDAREIKLLDGSVAQFTARSGKTARGFTGDLVILDEAFNLNSGMIAAMLPTMAARSIDGNPQIWYLSSAGEIGSDVLNGLRAQALGEDPPANLLWMEWSAPEEADSDDRSWWYVANPALGIRISEEYVADELEAFRADPERGETAWRRERLGIRERLVADSAIEKADWAACGDPDATAPGVPGMVAFAVDVPPERDSAYIAACWELPGERAFIELVDAGEGLSWVPGRLRELRDRWKPRSIVVDGKGAAAALLPDIKALGVVTRQVSMQDLGRACARTYDLIVEHHMVHPEQDELTEAVLSARRKMMGDAGMWKWDRKNPVAQIAPLIAATLALHGLTGRRKLGATRKPRRLHIG